MSTIAMRAFGKYFGGNEWSSGRHSVTNSIKRSSAYEDIAFVGEPTRTKGQYFVVPFAGGGAALLKSELQLLTEEMNQQIESFERRLVARVGLSGALNPYALSRTKLAGKQLTHLPLIQRRVNVEQPSIDVVFAKLAEIWKEETKYSSSLTKLIMHDAYQRIIGLGPDVIPYILRDLEVSGDQWFAALQSLTGENPIKPEDAGRVRKMREAWLEWGRENNYI